MAYIKSYLKTKVTQWERYETGSPFVVRILPMTGLMLIALIAACTSPVQVQSVPIDGAPPQIDGTFDGTPAPRWDRAMMGGQDSHHAEAGPQNGIDAIMHSLTPAEKIGQLIFVRYQINCDLFSGKHWGGVVFANAPEKDITTEAALRKSILDVHRCTQGHQYKLPMFTATNHEGGRVHYFNSTSKVTHFPSAAVQCSKGAPYVRQVSQAQASELAYMGIHVTLGPVADVLLTASSVIGDRAYAKTTALAAPCVESAVIGYHAEGLLATLKHFPGHGGIAADTHTSFAVDKRTMADIQQKYLPPFWAGLQLSVPAEFVMFSHVVYSSLDSAWPASLSSKAVQLLKSNTSPPFEGIAVTDDLNMNAVSLAWSMDKVAMLALMAGQDMLMFMKYDSAVQAQNALVAALQNGWEATVRNQLGKSQQFKFTAAEVQDRVHAALKRVLQVKQKAGLTRFDWIQKMEAIPEPDWEAHREL